MPKNAEKYVCEKCDFKCSKKCDYERHLMTPKHQNATEMLHNATYFTPKNADLICVVCDFKCCKLCDYDRHTHTRKHSILTNTNETTAKNAKTFEWAWISSCFLTTRSVSSSNSFTELMCKK